MSDTRALANKMPLCVGGSGLTLQSPSGEGAVSSPIRTSPSSPTKECRYCHDQGLIMDFESPCACKGSLKFAHRRCTEKWCHRKGNTSCEICLQPFSPGYTSSLGDDETARNPPWGTIGEHRSAIQARRAGAARTPSGFMKALSFGYAENSANEAAFGHNTINHLLTGQTTSIVYPDEQYSLINDLHQHRFNMIGHSASLDEWTANFYIFRGEWMASVHGLSMDSSAQHSPGASHWQHYEHISYGMGQAYRLDQPRAFQDHHVLGEFEYEMRVRESLADSAREWGRRPDSPQQPPSPDSFSQEMEIFPGDWAAIEGRIPEDEHFLTPTPYVPEDLL